MAALAQLANPRADQTRPCVASGMTWLVPEMLLKHRSEVYNPQPLPNDVKQERSDRLQSLPAQGDGRSGPPVAVRRIEPRPPLGVRPPVLWMLLYTGVFSLVLRCRSTPGYASFPEFLMAGLLPWMAIQEGIARSASVLVDNAAMVKKTVFPRRDAGPLGRSRRGRQRAHRPRDLRASTSGSSGISPSAWLSLVVPALLLQVAPDLRSRLHRGDARRPSCVTRRTPSGSR